MFEKQVEKLSELLTETDLLAEVRKESAEIARKDAERLLRTPAEWDLELRNESIEDLAEERCNDMIDANDMINADDDRMVEKHTYRTILFCLAYGEDPFPSVSRQIWEDLIQKHVIDLEVTRGSFKQLLDSELIKETEQLVRVADWSDPYDRSLFFALRSELERRGYNVLSFPKSPEPPKRIEVYRSKVP